MIYKLENVLKSKKEIKSIKNKIGKYLKNIINCDTTIIDLNNLNYSNIAKKFLEANNKEKILSNCISSETDLIECIAMEMESFTPRRYCVEKKKLDAKKVFKNFNAMKEICP